MGRASLRYGERRSVPRSHGFDPDTPVEGFYRMRLRSGGAYVGVFIWHGPPADPVTGEPLDRASCWNARINDRWADLADVWPRCADSPIGSADYAHLIAMQAWGREHVPDGALANPARRVDHLHSEILF